MDNIQTITPILENYSVIFASVFGSQAKNTARQNSDEEVQNTQKIIYDHRF